MKIGILTHHYVKNFGAYMQGYALIQTVKSICPEARVEIIDYRVKKHELKNIIRFLGFKPRRGDTIRGYIGKIGLFFTHRAYENKMPRSRKVNSSFEINALNHELIIIGADEVWNFSDCAYDAIKFGYGLDAPLITYSASAGGSSVKDCIPPEIKKGISNFKSISVRDEKTEELAVKLVRNGKRIERTLDPVFLYEYNLKVREGIKELVRKPYILIYDCRIEIAQATELENFAARNGLKIIGAGEYRKWYTSHAENITPFEWAFLFKKAWGIVTGTFHGTSFAIKYNRNFVAFLTEENRVNKVKSLLKEFDLSERIIMENNRNQILSVLQKPIDYSTVNIILDEKIRKSKEYLFQSIET